MPAKEIKELRQAGKLDEAYAMAKSEMEKDATNVWGKRNMSWVLYSQLDAAAGDMPLFLSKLAELKALNLPETEEMFFETISIVIAKAARAITHTPPVDLGKMHQLFDAVKDLPFKRNSKWYSVLFSAMQKGLKESHRYIEFADWWDFENFKPESYQKDKLPDGKEVMALAEQGYITYAKHLLPKQQQFGEGEINMEKIEAFIPKLSRLADSYPQFQYPPYFQAKLLLALGDKDNMLSALLPFAKKKRNDFWVWQILGEALSDDGEKSFACYCRALLCRSPEEMSVSLRQTMAALFVEKGLYDEAKTEITLLTAARKNKGWSVAAEVKSWMASEWYKKAGDKGSNEAYYKQYAAKAEALLFNDVPEESVLVTFVNYHAQILNFIASETKWGFFKYGRFLKDVKIGDTLSVRFAGGANEGPYQVLTAIQNRDLALKNKFIKDVAGAVKISSGKPFGFIDDVFVHSSLISKFRLTDGSQLKGQAMRSYNGEKKNWGWKLINVER